MDRRKALQKTGLMAGMILGTPTLLSLLQQCKTEERVDWNPTFLNAEEAAFISSFVDAILPRTETPGALDVKVDVFLDKLFSQGYDTAGQNEIRNDIKAFNQNCIERFGDNFASLKGKEKADILAQAEKDSAKFNSSIWGTAVGEPVEVGFYRSLKSMAIWAYFSSEEIGENVLSYDPIPQQYLGCIPVSDIGNRWSL